MLTLILGIIGFALYFLYDINSFTKQNKLLSSAFMAGTFLLALSTVMMLVQAWKSEVFSGFLDILLLILGLLMFMALIYCLFFALPFNETYTNPLNGRKTYTYGAYAFCRHPGVICFFLMYLFWGIAALPSDIFINGLIFSLLNIGYAAFQDRITFRKTFCDYDEYTQKVPFMIPTKASIHRAVKTWGRGFDEGGDL